MRQVQQHFSILRIYFQASVKLVKAYEIDVCEAALKPVDTAIKKLTDVSDAYKGMNATILYMYVTLLFRRFWCSTLLCLSCV